MARMLSGTRKGQTRRTARRAYMPKKTTRRRTRRKKGMLSELFNARVSEAAAKQVFSGAVGGAGAMLLEKVLSDNLTESQKGAYQIAAGFLTAAMFKKGYAGAGMSAIGISKLIEDNDLLGEDMMYSNVDMTQPLYLDENHYLAEDDMFLADMHTPNSYDVGYFPQGFGGM
jgi:hypothetical protein